MKGVANCYLFKRTEPKVNADKLGFFKLGDEVEIVDVHRGDFFEDICTWFELENGIFVWSGGIDTSKGPSNILVKKNTIDNKKSNQILDGNKEAESGLLIDFNFQSYILEQWNSSKEELRHTINYNKLLNFKPKYEKIKNSKGNGVVISILDCGIFQQHSAFSKAFSSISNPIDFTQSSNGSNDVAGHGTMVAGVIAGNLDLEIGFQGIAPESIIQNIKILSDSVQSSGITLESGLMHALKQKEKPDIINMSLDLIPAEQSVSVKKIMKKAGENFICVASAGENEDLLAKHLQYPASETNVIAVGTVNKKFIKKNPNAKFNSSLNYILPRYTYVSPSIKGKNKYDLQGRDTMASAIMSGLVALIIATHFKNKKPTVAQINQKLNQIAETYNPNIKLNSLKLIKL